MKRLEIVLERDQIPMVCGVLGQHSTGYTIIPEVTGYGHHGKRESGETVLLVTVVTRDHIDPILDILIPLLNQRSGVVLISDVQVLRGDHFVPELKARTMPQI
jgi:nitrogen regulatory protein PII